MRELGYFLNVDKPAGLTSRDVVDRVARAAGTKRVGHAGTLDPMATGVLVVAVDRATRLVEYVQAQPKTYEAEILLGQTSDTDDVEGTLSPRDVATVPTREDALQALFDFIGDIPQRPPSYSALKVQGQRAYRLSRKGQTPQLEPRTVHIYRIRLFAYNYPSLEIGVVCGSGTYIRSLARDLGERLGTGGLLCRLRRHGVGVFHVEDAVPLDAITNESVRTHARPLSDAVGSMPRVELTDDELRRFLLGQAVTLIREEEKNAADEVAVFAHGLLCGIGQWEGQVLRTLKAGFVELK